MDAALVLTVIITSLTLWRGGNYHVFLAGHLSVRRYCPGTECADRRAGCRDESGLAAYAADDHALILGVGDGGFAYVFLKAVRSAMSAAMRGVTEKSYSGAGYLSRKADCKRFNGVVRSRFCRHIPVDLYAI